MDIGIRIRQTGIEQYSRADNRIELEDVSLNDPSVFAEKIMNYIDEHQNDLFILNLDKKIFTLNLFSEITKN